MTKTTAINTKSYYDTCSNGDEIPFVIPVVGTVGGPDIAVNSVTER